MATGLATFDAFSWASLLKGRRILVVDRVAARGRATAEALEEAGAEATLASNQGIAGDRMREGTYRHVLVSLDAADEVRAGFAERLGLCGRGAIILADPSRHAALRRPLPAARYGDHSMDARSIVMFLTETADE
ncbi:hypothetical protein ASG43_06665 [Aureimonas sp. Leaf454]|uniref:hypothetical protein n=1 Tax=Aureimonas sp. Leaf454 TaxID=1736381 RepID=UPI000701203F|nr:hypothetical protein [Aureimonas sp. Leaf454]KQT50925.1 hypothetical protein ASG43_06665 [Aureimonas sp. Leaf454]